MTKLAVLITHGMGTISSTFHEGLVRELERRLRRKGVDPSEIEFQPVNWSEVLAPAQEALFKKLDQFGKLDCRSLRRFVLCSLGDAVAYRQVDAAKNGSTVSIYQQIHDAFKKAISDLHSRIQEKNGGGEVRVPLVVVAHSMGGHVISNYIWDLQNGKEPSRGNDFEDLKTLTAIHTMGCNIPIFILALTKFVPIRFPLPVRKYWPKATESELSAITRWSNFYDPDDVLGWPLQPLHEEVFDDHPINSGNILKSWNPLSHTSYWTDDDFTIPLANQLGTMIEILKRS